MKAPAQEERIHLLNHNGTDIYVQYTETPWLLDVDAFTLPAGAGGGLKAEIAKAFLEFLGPSFSRSFKELITVQKREKKFSSENPLLIEFSREFSEMRIPASHVFIATEGVKSWSGPSDAGLAASTIVKKAQEQSGFSRIAVPLLGLEEFDFGSVSEFVFADIQKTLRPNNQVKEIILTTHEPSAVEFLVELAKEPPVKKAEPNSENKALEAMQKLTGSGKKVLQYAWAIGKERNYGPIDPLLMFVGLLLLGEQGKVEKSFTNSAQFLYDYFFRKHTPKKESYFESIISLLGFDKKDEVRVVPDFGKRLPKLESFSEDGIKALEASLKIAEQTAPDKKIHLRPLIGALLTTPPSARITQELERSGYDLADLKKEFLGLIETRYSKDNQEAWREILTGATADAETSVDPAPVAELDYGRVASKNDQPADTDLLGHGHLVRALGAMLADPTQGTPFTIGLLGAWGTGKSTVMNLLKKHLEAMDEGRFIFAYFNAWEYERTENLPAGLAQEVVGAFVEKGSWWDTLKLRLEFALREHGIGALRIAFYATVAAGIPLLLVWAIGLGEPPTAFKNAIGYGAAGGLVGLGVYLWRSLKNVVEHPLSVQLRTYLKLPSYGEHLGLIPVLKRHIETLGEIRLGTHAWRMQKRKKALGFIGEISSVKRIIEKLTGKNEAVPNRLIVFVDDLDRCDPRSISNMLDAIRLVMDLEHIITIVGIDHRIAFRAVGDHYKKLEDEERTAEDIARDYLGKIIQLPIMLHRPTKSELDLFVSGALFPDAQSSETEPAKVTGDGNADTSESETEEVVLTPESGSKEPDVKREINATPLVAEEEEVVINLVKPEEPADPLKKEMVFTIEESDHFGRLAHDFHLRNPRQLRRLRNTYGLLKLLYALGKEDYFAGIEIPGGNDSTDLHIMTLLFWKEFEYDHSNLVEEVWKQVETINGKKTPDQLTDEDDPSLKVAVHLASQGLQELNPKHEKVYGLERFVDRFVLPQKISKKVTVPEAPAKKVKK